MFVMKLKTVHKVYKLLRLMTPDTEKAIGYH